MHDSISNALSIYRSKHSLKTSLADLLIILITYISHFCAAKENEGTSISTLPGLNL